MEQDEVWPPAIPNEELPKSQRPSNPIKFVARCLVAGAMYGLLAGGAFGALELSIPGFQTPSSFLYIQPVIGFLAGAAFGLVVGLVTGAIIGLLSKHTRLCWCAGVIAATPGYILMAPLLQGGARLWEIWVIVGPAAIACAILAMAAAQYKSDRPKMPLVRWVQDADC